MVVSYWYQKCQYNRNISEQKLERFIASYILSTAPDRYSYSLSLLFGELSASISCRRDVGTTTVPDVLYYNCCCQHHPSLPHCPFLFNSHKLTSPSLHFLFASIRVDQQQRSKWKQEWRVSLTLVIEISQRWPYPCCTKRELT